MMSLPETPFPLSAAGADPGPSWRQRLLAHRLPRAVLATLLVVAPLPLVMALARQLFDKPMRQAWPELLCAALCVLAYRWYVQRVEQRAVSELSLAGAGRELGAGLVLGAALFLSVIAMLAAAGAYRIEGSNSWTALLLPLTEMAMVALFEEILFRAVIFRIAEQAMGSVAALLLSAVIFALAHLPNEHITMLAVAITVAAGLMFGAAYMATRRLWLAVGLHFAWNYVSSAVFSLPTSGQAGKGWLVGQTSGAEWLTGGAYGVEGSACTLLSLLVLTWGLLALARRRSHIMARPARNKGRS